MNSSEKYYSVIYEVNLKLKNEISDAFEIWLKDKHIDEMLKFDGFVSASLLSVDDMEIDKDHKYITVLYYVESKDKLNKYFELHASEKRAEGIKLFGDKFSATRRVLSLHKQFESC